jgi:hypothetical protein
VLPFFTVDFGLVFNRRRHGVDGSASPALLLAPEEFTLPESTDISRKGLTVVEFNCEPVKFSFQRTVDEGSH